MKSIYSRMAAVALTLSLGFAAGTANAVALVLNSWDYSNPGQAELHFKNNGPLISAGFTDWLDFSLPGASTGDGGTSVSANFNSAAKITRFELQEYTSALRNVTLGSAISGVIGGFSSGLGFTNKTVPGFYRLFVEGHSARNYTGSVVTPVPEPETYAMMLAGLGLLGFSARRRNKNV